MRRFFLIATLLTVLAVSSSAQIFYKVSGNGLEKPSWLFGTHHLAPLSVLDSIRSAKAALDRASTVVGEIDMTVPKMELAMKITPYMTAPSDSTLRSVIKPDVYERISKEFVKYSPVPGATLDMFNSMRPMVVTAMVTMGIVGNHLPGFNPEEQLDSYIENYAKDNNKRIVALETAEQQAELLYAGQPIEKQARDLVELLEDPDKVVENAVRLNDSYLTQDVEKMLSLTESADSEPELMEALLKRRNANWLKILPSVFKEGETFVAVGALHLLGADGLVERLREAGFTVEPVWR